MNHRPPALAIWLLERFSAPYRRDALIGDLLEEHQRGRSQGWFWRQTALALLSAARSRHARRPLPGAMLLLLWWLTLVATALALKSAVPLLLLVDPGVLIWLHRGRRLRRG